MFELIKVLFDICLFKKSPASLPYSVWLLRILILLDAGISFLLASMSAGWLRAFSQALVGVVLIIAFAWAMLAVARKLSRFSQTTCALLGTDALISFFAIPGTATVALGQYSVWIFLVMTALIIWHWTITGHIIRNALGQTLAFGLGLAFLYILAAYQVMGFLFPDLGAIQTE